MKKILEPLSKEYGFTPKQLEHIYTAYLKEIATTMDNNFKNLVENPKLLSKEEFLNVKENRVAFTLPKLGDLYIHYNKYQHEHKKYHKY